MESHSGRRFFRTRKLYPLAKPQSRHLRLAAFQRIDYPLEHPRHDSVVRDQFASSRTFEHGEALKPARLYLQEVVNKSLAELVAPRLLWKTPDRNEMGLFMVPSNLIGCLWLQLADAIAGFQKFRLCENESCRKPMLVAAEGSGYRTNRKTCSNACRIRLYSGRKLEARQLRDQKLSLREIAKRLDTGVEQVKRWIAKN